MSKSKCHFTTFLKSRVRYILVGGVLSALTLALIPHSVSAMTYSSTNPTFTNANLLIGCNSVNSDEGYLAIGPRGSLFGVDENNGGCGYYWYDGQLGYYQNNSNSGASIVFDPITGDAVNYSTPTGRVSSSYDYADYIKHGFRAVLKRWSNSFDTGSGYYQVSALTDSKFGKYFVYGLIDYNTSYSSFLIPSLTFNQGEEPIRADNGYNVDIDEFTNDVYSTTIFVNANDMKIIYPNRHL